MSSISSIQLSSFLKELEKLPMNTQLCLARLLSEIHEVGLGHIGGCPWREPHKELLECLPALRVLAPSVHIIEHKREGKVVLYGVRWTYCQFAMPICPEITLLWNEVQKKVALQRNSIEWTVMI
jgi:hypothetical protein